MRNSLSQFAPVNPGSHIHTPAVQVPFAPQDTLAQRSATNTIEWSNLFIYYAWTNIDYLISVTQMRQYFYMKTK